MTTTTNVQQVKVNKVTQAQYDSMTKNDNEFYVIVDKEYLEGITSADVTTALGYTPISAVTSSMVTSALGYTPYNSTNPAGYITGITSSMVTTALGYTPANASGVQTVQDIATITTTAGTISQTVTNDTSMYQITPSGAITSFSFDYTGTANKAYTFELLVNMSTVYAINWVGIAWMGGEIPDMSETGTYFLAFRKVGTGGWIGNLQGKW